MNKKETKQTNTQEEKKDYWERYCKENPTASECKLYDV